MARTFKYYTVYRITNLQNGMIYIGWHATNDINDPNDTYMGSGRLIKEAIQQFGLDNFKREYLFVFDDPDKASEKEAELVNDEFVCRSDTYNIMTGGRTGKGITYPQPHFPCPEKNTLLSRPRSVRRKIPQDKKQDKEPIYKIPSRYADIDLVQHAKDFERSWNEWKSKQETPNIPS